MCESEPETERERIDLRTENIPVRRQLPVALSPEERLELLNKAGRLQNELLEIENDLREYKARANARLQEKTEEFLRCLDEARTWTRVREVDCEERRDYALGEVFVVRLDTMEVVERRPLKRSEKQTSLPLPEPEPRS